ncbi:hypothetical protein BWQ96_01183 [Gracilariopsis chorda]|uniref:Uncharacterized protein n=1 Tax=Gracilariopsis chorda TaxID=448386 RepID=A0A2V3J3S6_9FLOR|nr:hypothetical protein BWQ96_01183 [Gracilariopsis chorda]|eukprot:PXF49045.1 hypothetical protein BWQ96_01183 [Gracilariopsis chorda]
MGTPISGPDHTAITSHSLRPPAVHDAAIALNLTEITVLTDL